MSESSLLNNHAAALSHFLWFGDKTVEQFLFMGLHCEPRCRPSRDHVKNRPLQHADKSLQPAHPFYSQSVGGSLLLP